MALSRLSADVRVSDEDVLVAFSINPRCEPGQDVDCHYEVLSDYTVQSRDYVAVYPAEHFQPTALRRYITWQWADVNTKEGHRTVIFPSRHLPRASSTYFLFAYVSWSQGVIGQSEQFQILYFSGDPVSLVSVTTEKSSFVILEKAIGNADISSCGYQNDVSKHADCNELLVLSEGTIRELSASTSESESGSVNPMHSHEDGILGNDPQVDQTETGPFVTNTENQENTEVSCSSDALGCVGNNPDSQPGHQVFDHLPNVKTDQDEEIERLKSENIHLRSKVHLAEEAAENWKSAAETCAKEVAISEGRIRELEKGLEKLNVDLVDKNEKAVVSHQQDEDQIIAAVVQENEILRRSVESLQAQLHESETALSQTQEKLRLYKSRRRDLEQALIRERLSYEVTLRNLAASEDHPLAHVNGHKDPETEYHTTTEERVDQKSDDTLASLVPLSQRSASALVRLGIEDQQETRQVFEPVNRMSSVRCPVCSTSASTFTDEAAFSAHVNGHFPD